MLNPYQFSFIFAIGSNGFKIVEKSSQWMYWVRCLACVITLCHQLFKMMQKHNTKGSLLAKMLSKITFVGRQKKGGWGVGCAVPVILLCVLYVVRLYIHTLRHQFTVSKQQALHHTLCHLSTQWNKFPAGQRASRCRIQMSCITDPTDVNK